MEVIVTASLEMPKGDRGMAKDVQIIFWMGKHRSLVTVLDLFLGLRLLESCGVS
jgi:hypothetical protein